MANDELAVCIALSDIIRTISLNTTPQPLHLDSALSGAVPGITEQGGRGM